MELKAISFLTAAVLLGSASAASSAVTVTIDPAPRQTLTSFGASGAWWPNDLIHFPASVQQNLSNFLFSPDGLFLSSYRYNMGGDGGDDAQQVVTNGSRVESFLLRNGTYDWSRDHAGVTFLKSAQSYGVPYITFFVNAAPSHIATNGAACGWYLTPNKASEFADYIKTVLSYWTENGINIRYISPINEPDNARTDCGQEGMAVFPTFRPTVFSAISSALKSNASRVSIIGDETSLVTIEAFPEYSLWLPLTAQYLSNIAMHNYDYPSDQSLTEYYAEVLNLTSGHPPPVKFTETCCSTNGGTGFEVFGVQYDPTMVNALIVARYVWQFLTIIQAQSFDWWTAVTNLPCSPTIDGPQCATSVNETAGYNSGLVYIDPNYNQTHDYNLYFTKRAFMMKHFAYFHRPGSQRFDIPQAQLPEGVNAIATKLYNVTGENLETAETWSVLFMNNETSSYDFTLRLPSPRASIIQIVQTTPQADWQAVQPLPVVDSQQGTVTCSVPGQSMWTMQLVIDNGAAITTSARPSSEGYHTHLRKRW